MKGEPKITVLYYHEVVPNGQGYSYQKIDVDKFDAQMSYIKKCGFHSTTFEEIAAGKCPDKPIIVTFDDGFRSVYDYAMPILQKYGIKATLFLPCKYIDENHPYYMSWGQIKELVDMGVASIGGHTYSHIDIRIPDEEGLTNEIIRCNESVAKNLNIRPVSVCFPYGAFNKRAIKIVRRVGGYKFLVASYFGKTCLSKTRKKLVQRIGISNSDSWEVFIRKLNGKENYRGIIQRARIAWSNINKKYVTKYKIDF